MGTDYPADMGEVDPIGFVEGTRSLDDPERRAILGGNAARLLGIEVPARNWLSSREGPLNQPPPASRISRSTSAGLAREVRPVCAGFGAGQRSACSRAPSAATKSSRRPVARLGGWYGSAEGRPAI